MKKLIKNQKGFTLVELLAVIVILGIIAAIAIPSIGGIIDNTKKDAHIANAEMMVSGARLAVASNDTGALGDPTGPATGNKYYEITLAELIQYGYLEEDFLDPDTGKKYDITKASKVNVEVIEATTTAGKQYRYYVTLIGDSKQINDTTTNSLGVPSTDLDRKKVSAVK